MQTRGQLPVSLTCYQPRLPPPGVAKASGHHKCIPPDHFEALIRGILCACPDSGCFPSTVGVILVVGHGSALDTCTRPLLGLPPLDCTDFAQLVRKVCAPSFLLEPRKQAA